MSSKRNVLREFQLPEASRNRKKVDIDGFRLIEAEKEAPWQREQEKPDRFKSKYDLRKSLAWDSAFFTSPGVLDPEELFETLNFHDGDNGDSQSDLKEANGLPSESLAASRIGECFVRRSLAWDSAFFTSAGVLDPEELSMVNKGYKKSETQNHILPGIEEEFWKSADSNSTIDSDYSLASLEFDLFDDMRASMHKSSKAYNLVNSSSNLQSQTGRQNPHSSKRLDTTKFQIKPLPASRRQTVSMHGGAKIAKEATNPPRAQHATQCGEQNTSSSLKLSKKFSQANPLSAAATKRASLGANHLKMEKKIRKAASGQIMTKKPCFGDSGSVIPSLTLSPEPVSSRWRIASRDFGQSDCTQSTPIAKSPNSLRRKNNLAACDSSSRTPCRSLSRSKNKLLDSTQLTHLPSTPNSSCTSLSSSVGCWSAESSTSRNYVSSNFSTSVDIAFRRGVSAASQRSHTKNRSCDQPFVQNESKKTRLAYQDVNGFSKESSPLPPAVSREIKPSGLRMPSPKIGFFDVENFSALTPNGGLKFHSGMQSTSKLRNVLHHPNGNSNRGRVGKLQPPRTSTRSSNMKERKMGSQQTGNQTSKGIKPCCTIQLEGEKACQEFTLSGTITSSLATSFMAGSDSSCEWSSGNGLKTDGLGSYSKEVIRPDSQGHANQIVNSSLNQNEDASGHPLENQPHSDDKENLFSFENEVDVLSKQIEAIDFRGDLVIEF
ncbi:uncharacterized protein LOC110424991 [Herrania umbratica]|uniref:Uncharacterized protein LOC110424991 n=1 Tax=Herrania umbratica TaxID=108875 RepID=A0A6J1B7M2_9ROSI|nr:uncharacterized protein LOC110424991 [Herrania umbratica]